MLTDSSYPLLRHKPLGSEQALIISRFSQILGSREELNRGGSGSESPEVPRRLHHPESWLGPEGRRLAAGLRSPPTGLSSSSPWGSSRRMSYASWRGSWAPRKAGGKRAATTEALGFISKFQKVLPGAIGPTARP